MQKAKHIGSCDKKLWPYGGLYGGFCICNSHVTMTHRFNICMSYLGTGDNLLSDNLNLHLAVEKVTSLG
jgi:hypothetical protein